VSRRLFGSGCLLTPWPTHHWSILFMSSVMYEKVDERVRELEQILRQMSKLPLDMRVTDTEQAQREELRELKAASRTTCPLNAVLIVTPPDVDAELDEEREELRRFIYEEMFGLCYRR